MTPASEKPCDVQTHKVQRPFALVAGLLVAMFGGFLLLFVGQAIADPDRFSPMGIAFGVFVFGGMLTYGLSLASTCMASVTVDERGLSRRAPGRSPQFIPWEDVASVRAEDGRQRLVVQDRSSAEQIVLDYQLAEFDALRKAIEERARFRNDRPEHQTVFWRGLSVYLLLLGIACGAAALLLVIPWDGSAGATLFFAAFGALVAFLLWLPCVVPFRVEIRPHELELRSVARAQVIPFSQIAAVELSTRNENNMATIQLTRTDKRAVGLGSNFRGGSLALYEAIKAAWEADRSGAGAKITPEGAGSASA